MLVRAVQEVTPVYTEIIRKVSDHFRSTPAGPVKSAWQATNREGLDATREQYGTQCWLARYVARSEKEPGAIQFHRTRLGQYWRYTLHRLSVRSQDGSSVALMLAWMVFAHEQYHWIGHSLRDRMGDSLRAREEALATAWAWRTCQIQGVGAGISSQLVEAVARLWFDHITAPGYSDWIQFAHPCSFSFESLAFLGQDIPVSRAKLSMRGCFYEVVDGPDDNNLDVVDSWYDGRALSLPLKKNASALRYKGYSLSPYDDEIDLSDRGLATVEAVSRAVAAQASSRSTGRTILSLCHNRLDSLHYWHEDGHKDSGTTVLRNANVDTICFRHQRSGLVPTHLLGLQFTKPPPVRLFFDDLRISEILAVSKKENIHECQEVLIDAGYAPLARL